MASRIGIRELKNRTSEIVHEVQDLAREAVRLLRGRHLVELFPVTEALTARAAEIAADEKIRGCDAIYVALARQLEMELVTQDGQQHDRGAAVVRTRRP